MQKTAVVIPCFNESERLDQRQFLQFARENPDVDFFFVNDGSTDDTDKLLDKLCKQNPRQLKYINLERNRGKAEAVRRGMLAVTDGSYDLAGYWDADLATPLSSIGRFREILEDRSISAVLGSRVRLLGRDIERKPSRHYLGRIFATLASFLLGLTVYDTQCGSKLFRVNDALRMVFDKPFFTSWIFDVEVLARFMMLTGEDGTENEIGSIIEYPLEKWMDVPGSKLRLFDFFKAGYELMTIFLMIRIPFLKNRSISSLKSS